MSDCKAKLRLNKATLKKACENIIDSGLRLGAGDFVEMESLKVAVAALTELYEREANEPLTLDELQGMKGEPVWLEGISPSDEWAQVQEVYPLVVSFFFFGDDGEYGFRKANYGKTWRAYRYRPKEEK